MAKDRLRIRARNYYGTEFNVKTRGPMQGPILDNGPTKNWGVKFCGSYVSITLGAQLQCNR